MFNIHYHYNFYFFVSHIFSSCLVCCFAWNTSRIGTSWSCCRASLVRLWFPVTGTQSTAIADLMAVIFGNWNTIYGRSSFIGKFEIFGNWNTINGKRRVDSVAMAWLIFGNRNTIYGRSSFVGMSVVSYTISSIFLTDEDAIVNHRNISWINPHLVWYND